eukprot:CAMPEP_0119398742 /NCGR_PEP_ID=MMETSP1334-20130426/140998_1 /TAXON_ID=127549 /ORGANISM="Calcidiscus leptoporus, Strain RCC1130" /LENGTH=488 /DNA_ID=CAMNT_0007422611 /DNA_START=53 /DNA_END=1520 /DNA_ORIENTATION=+
MAETQGSTPTNIRQSSERVVKIKKASREARIGLRLGLHPVSRQVIISELYHGYPAIETGRLFVGDVITKVGGVAVTEVDMTLQLIKMAPMEVELRTTNVYIEAVKQVAAKPRPPDSCAASTDGAAPPTGGATAASSDQGAPAPNLMDNDLLLDDSDFFVSMQSASPLSASQSVPPIPPPPTAHPTAPPPATVHPPRVAPPPTAAAAGPDLMAAAGPDLMAAAGPDLMAAAGPDLMAAAGPDLMSLADAGAPPTGKPKPDVAQLTQQISQLYPAHVGIPTIPPPQLQQATPMQRNPNDPGIQVWLTFDGSPGRRVASRSRSGPGQVPVRSPRREQIPRDSALASPSAGSYSGCAWPRRVSSFLSYTGRRGLVNSVWSSAADPELPRRRAMITGPLTSWATGQSMLTIVGRERRLLSSRAAAAARTLAGLGCFAHERFRQMVRRDRCPVPEGLLQAVVIVVSSLVLAPLCFCSRCVVQLLASLHLVDGSA